MRKNIRNSFIAVLLCICMAGCSADDISDIGNLESKVEEVVENSIQDAEKSEECVTKIDDTEEFWINFIDVGQADAALVQCDGHYMLIDGGNKDDSRKIYSLIRDNEIEALDLIIASHAHEDHIGGLAAALTATSSKITLCPVTYYDSDAFKDFAKLALLRGGGITVPEIGDKVTLGSATVEILGMSAGGEDENDSSIVCKVVYEDTSFLFTGDATHVSETVLMENGKKLSATVLKVGHHGSETSTGEDFLNTVNPEIAIISVGKENEYGHPTADVLQRLDKVGSQILRTDLQGDIKIISDGQNVSVTAEKEALEEEILTPGEIPAVKDKQPEKEENEGREREYVANKRSLKLHLPECESVRKMSESNKLYLHGTRNEMIDKGYDPCGDCRP